MNRRSGPGIEPATDVRLGEDRQPVAHAGELYALARGERVEVLVRGACRGLGEPAGDHLQPVRIEMLDDRRQARLDAACAQRANLVAHVALGLAQVVRLGEALSGQRLVGERRVAAVREGVVHGGP